MLESYTEKDKPEQKQTNSKTPVTLVNEPKAAVNFESGTVFEDTLKSEVRDESWDYCSKLEEDEITIVEFTQSNYDDSFTQDIDENEQEKYEL